MRVQAAGYRSDVIRSRPNKAARSGAGLLKVWLEQSGRDFWNGFRVSVLAWI